MPRRSGHAQSDENPPPRRQSARIAAVQAASPAKSPAKSPRRKKQSTEANKAQSEDTESQQSQIKSESSVEELNGLETSSSKDRESVVDSQEIPTKKAKVDEENGGKLVLFNTILVDAPKNEVPAPEVPAPEHDKPSAKEAMDFEVVEKSDVPPPDSAEVRAAVSVQGEDGQLLVGFVQVDKDDLPSATSVEVKQPTTEEPETQTSNSTAAPSVTETPVENSVNGDSNHHPEPAPAAEPEVQTKVPAAAADVAAQPVLAPAAGDGTADTIVSDPVQQ
ncbi:unnamed protein product [Echinostoma caproni]|uniref:Nucleolin-like n=1 Tax=Echinostoma caproni TaxID=27848 RepID=A0A183AI29_9TREM|nr:unnamed protein product [Echinostoma caproni]